MTSSRNSASLKSSISISSSSRAKFQSQMKLQDPALIKISEATPCQCTTSLLTAAGHQRIGRTLEHLRKKDIRGPVTKDSHRAAKEAVHQIVNMVVTKALTHSNFHVACSMVLLTLGLPLPQDTNNLQSYICFWQSARCQKHREGLHTWPQKCPLPTGRARVAQHSL
jgi:hypothetical protein